MRNYKIDLLRFTGLIMIMLAHIHPPSFLFQLRNFDVPLMVFVSGVSFKLSYKKGLGYWQYVWKRIKRLVFPVWIFLSFFFIVFHFLLGSEITKYQIITSYLFLSGIGYVWIIRVFLLVALSAPFLILIDKKINSNNYFLLFLLVSFSLYEIFQLNTYSYFQTNVYLKSISHIIFYLIPYSIIYLFGIRIINLSKKQVTLLCLLFSFVFIGLATFFYIKEGHFVQTQAYKYPVSTYYLSYALMISLALWISGDIIWKKLNSKIKDYILFISKNSIWTYLWHIPAIYLINKTNMNFLIEYSLVIILSISIVMVQTYVLEKIIIPRLTNEQLIKNLRVLFKG